MVVKIKNKGTRALTLNINKSLPKSKRSQVTIFIIAGIVLIAIILLLLFLKGGKDTDIDNNIETNPSSFLQSCLEDHVREAIQIIGENGGYVEPEFYIDFNFTNEPETARVAYLCYTSENHTPCTNYEGILRNTVENEIKSYISNGVGNCTDKLTERYADAKYTVEVRNAGDFDLTIKRDLVVINIKTTLVLTKGSEVTKEENFVINVESKIYDILFTVQRIINDDISKCDFDIADYIFKYSKYKIDKESTSDFSEIYTIRLKTAPEMFRFATRGCVDLPGA